MYPTLKYGDPKNLTEYRGSRGLEDLQAFAVAHLTPQCSLDYLDLCNNETKQQLLLVQSYENLSINELDEAIQKEEAKLQQAEMDFQDALTILQEKYQAILKEKYTTISDVKSSSGLSHMKYILLSKVQEEEKEKEQERLQSAFEHHSFQWYADKLFLKKSPEKNETMRAHRSYAYYLMVQGGWLGD